MSYENERFPKVILFRLSAKSETMSARRKRRFLLAVSGLCRWGRRCNRMSGGRMKGQGDGRVAVSVRTAGGVARPDCEPQIFVRFFESANNKSHDAPQERRGSQRGGVVFAGCFLFIERSECKAVPSKRKGAVVRWRDRRSIP